MTNKAPSRTTPAVSSYAWVILVVVFLASVAAPLNQAKIPPLMPVIMDAFQISLGQAGWLMSVFALTGLILSLPAGIFLQKFGPKKLGLVALSCLTLGATIGALSSNPGLLIFSRVIEGSGMGLIAVVAPAAIAMWFPAERQGIPMGIWGYLGTGRDSHGVCACSYHGSNHGVAVCLVVGSHFLTVDSGSLCYLHAYATLDGC